MTTVLPEINFLETDPQQLANEIITTYENAEGRKLAQGDPLYLIFLSLASVVTKQNVKINDAAKQNLLYYARASVLDHKGAEWWTYRLEATAATTKLRMHLSAPLTSSRIVEKGALATSNEGAIFFGTDYELIIPPGVDHIDVDMTCTVTGEIGNGFAVGQINTLVKPLPYIDYVENITVSNGGAEREVDEAYRERVYMAPEKLSNAGSEGAYEYFARKASALISDVYVYMPTPGYVNISVLLQNGELPTQEILDMVYESCTPRHVRPLTDCVTVEAPQVVEYDLNVTYYLETESIDKELIRSKIERAIDDFIVWQSEKIGRDINPSKLIREIVRARAKRAEIGSPSFTIVNPGQVAQIRNKNVVFGGVEDD